MIGVLALLGYTVGFALGMVAGNYVFPGSMAGAVLTGLAVGGLLGTVAPVVLWSTIPPAFRNFVRAAKTGVLIVAVGADKKLRLLPGRSDGFVIRPVDKPYREKYVWAADGESAYPVHQGKGVQGIITFMGYPFPLDAKKAVAISKFREKGFQSLEDLKTAVELPESSQVEARLEELEKLASAIQGMSEEKVEEKYGVEKARLLSDINSEIERLRGIKELIQQYGDKATVVDVDGGTVRASDLISYLVWRHHPAEIERVIKAETNAVLSRMNFMDWVRQLTPVIILATISIIGILAAIYLLKGGSPAATSILHNASQIAHNATSTKVITISPPGG